MLPSIPENPFEDIHRISDDEIELENIGRVRIATFDNPLFNLYRVIR